MTGFKTNNQTVRQFQGYNNFSILLHDENDVQLSRRLWYTVSGYYMIFVIVIGVMIHGVVLNTFRCHKQLINSNNQLLLFVMMTDVIMLAISFPMVCASSLQNRWLFGDFGCQWYGGSMTTLGLGSIMILTSSAIQRFTAVVFVQGSVPSQFTWRRSIRTVGVCFLFSLTLALLPAIGVGSYSLETYVFSCTPTWWANSTANLVYVAIILLSGFVLPIAIITVCYVGIVIKVCYSPLNSMSRQKQIKMAVVTFCFIASFLLSWSAYAITAILTMFKTDYEVTPWGNILPVLMAKSCVLWNPLIYTCTNSKFRQELLSDLNTLSKSFLGLRRCFCDDDNGSGRSVPSDTNTRVSSENDPGDRCPEETTGIVQHYKANKTYQSSTVQTCNFDNFV